MKTDSQIDMSLSIVAKIGRKEAPVLLEET